MASDEPARAMCCGRVHDPLGSWGHRFKQCKNPAKVERDGNPYCGVHDPERRKAKLEANYTKHMTKWDAEKRAIDRRNLERDACDGVSDDDLRRVIEAGGLAAMLKKGGGA